MLILSRKQRITVALAFSCAAFFIFSGFRHIIGVIGIPICTIFTNSIANETLGVSNHFPYAKDERAQVLSVPKYTHSECTVAHGSKRCDDFGRFL